MLVALPAGMAGSSQVWLAISLCTWCPFMLQFQFSPARRALWGEGTLCALPALVREVPLGGAGACFASELLDEACSPHPTGAPAHTHCLSLVGSPGSLQDGPGRPCPLVWLG